MPHLIITDINMPEITGIELTEKLRKQGFNMPVFFVSAYENFEYTRKGIDIGVSGYVLKPVEKESFEAVLEKIKAILDKPFIYGYRRMRWKACEGYGGRKRRSNRVGACANRPCHN